MGVVMISIAKAMVGDLPKLEKMGHEFYEEGNIPTKFVPEVFIRNWTKFLENELGVIYTLHSEGNVVGAIGGVRFNDVNSDELIATEFFWFVKQGYRGYGMQLLQKFEDWAKEHGVTKIIMVHLHDLMPDKLRRIYKRYGYKEVETHYIKEVG